MSDCNPALSSCPGETDPSLVLPEVPCDPGAASCGPGAPPPGEGVGSKDTTVARRPTSLTRAQMAKILAARYQALFGSPPSQQLAELLLAQLSLENASGRAIQNHNWGNITTKDSARVPFWRPTWFDLSEIQARPDSPRKSRDLNLHQRMLAGKAPRAFRAFNSHDAGADAYLEFLHRDRFFPIVKAAEQGDARRFAGAIFETGYCPDEACRPEKTAASFAALQREIRAQGVFAGLPKASATGGSGAGLVLTAGLGAAALWWLRRGKR